MHRARSRTPLLVLAAALVLAGCERLPDEIVYVVGEVTDPADVPLSGLELTLWRSESSCSVGAGFTSVEETPAWEEGYFEVAKARSNKEGAFAFELLYGEVFRDSQFACLQVRSVQEGKGELRVHMVAHAGRDANLGRFALAQRPLLLEKSEAGGWLLSGEGPQASQSEAITARDAQLAELNMYRWVSWELWAAPRPKGQGFSYPVWLQPRTGEPLSLSPFILEDFPKVRALAGLREPRWREDARDPLLPFDEPRALRYSLALGSPRTELPPGGIVPASRGSRCLFDGDELSRPGQTVPRAEPEACPLTDGVLGPSAATRAKTIELHLSRPIFPAHAIVRGLVVNQLTAPIRFRVSGSSDGVTFVPLGELPLVFISADTPAVLLSGVGAVVHESPGLGYGSAALTAPDMAVSVIRFEDLGKANEGTRRSIAEISVFERPHPN